jgi:hypothetical protein
LDDTAAWVKYFNYLTVCGLGGFGNGIFQAFWVQMRRSSEEMMDSSVRNTTLAIHCVLAKMGTYMFWPDASMEMDDFYDLLDRAREDCKDSVLASRIQVSSFVRPPFVISLTCFSAI